MAGGMELLMVMWYGVELSKDDEEHYEGDLKNEECNGEVVLYDLVSVRTNGPSRKVAGSKSRQKLVRY